MASFDYDVRLGETLAVPWCTPWWPSEARWWSQVRSGHRIKETQHGQERQAREVQP